MRFGIVACVSLTIIAVITFGFAKADQAALDKAATSENKLANYPGLLAEK